MRTSFSLFIYINIFFIICPLFGKGQIISTVAGNGVRGYSGDSAEATAAQLDQPIAVTVDDSGNIYIVDAGANDNIRKVSANGIISTITGNHVQGEPLPYSSDSSMAIETLVWWPRGIVADHSGNIYFPESGYRTIRKISPGGIINTIAGRPHEFIDSKDSNLAVNTRLRRPNGIALDRDENIYFADEKDNMVRKISKKEGIITTIAGSGTKGFSGDGGLAIYAELDHPWGLAADNHGNIYFTDKGNERVRKVNNNGIITTIAGTGDKGNSGDGRQATNASFDGPAGIAVDKSGNIYIADSRNDAIRQVNSEGIITTFAGNHHKLYHGDDGIYSSIVYSHDKGNAGDGGPATRAQLHWPYDVAVDAAGNVYIADNQNHVIRKVTMAPPQKKDTQVPNIKNDRINEDTMSLKSQQEFQPGDAFTISTDAKQNTLTITIDSDAYTSFTITSNKDIILIRQSLNDLRTKVDVSALLPGQYYINLKKGSKVKTAWFIKDN
jgi:sugar lactone lactonase YvrE